MESNRTNTRINPKNDKIWAREYKLYSDAEYIYDDWEIFNAPIEKIK